jgi:type II restriction enzyme
MRYLNTYKKMGLQNNVNTVFNYFIKTLKESIVTWDYFVDWKKINKNIKNIEKELNLLNYLIGKENIEAEFLNLIREYPSLKKVLPILIAVRSSKLKYMSIIIDFDSLNYNKILPIFSDSTIQNNENKIIEFFNESGLKDIFKDKTVKNLVDYCYGVEVGLDTNARKNRTGNLMEDIIEKFIKKFSDKNKLEFITQATNIKIQNNWKFEISVDRYDRVFDFAIYNKKNNKIYLIETNYYSGTGSKLKATAGEYKDLYAFLKNQKIDFIWITDGLGWQRTKNPLFETFNNNDYVFNLELLNQGVFNEIILSNL